MSDDGKRAPYGLVFPGQGSQTVGMGEKVYRQSPAAEELLDRAEDLLRDRLPKPLTSLIFEGPSELLDDTVNTQPALFAVSIAYYRAFAERIDDDWPPVAVAGHSLGHYAALVAAGAIRFNDGLTLVCERGRLMKEADRSASGGMAAVIGLDHAVISEICERASSHGIITPANVNSPGQIVISGELPALEAAIEALEEAGARRVIRLDVSIAAHSELMAPIADKFADVVDRVDIVPPRLPVIDNITAKPLETAAAIRRGLIDHLRRPVLWTAGVERMAAMGAKRFYEVGPGNVLSRLIERTRSDLQTTSLDRVDWWK